MLEPLFGIHLGIAALLLRLAIGSLYVYHGYPKMGAARKGTAEWLKSIGFPGSLATLAGVVEFFGGIALILGILTSIVAVLSALWMVATTWLSMAKIKKKYAGGYELDITLLLVSLALAAIGGGSFSLDHLLRI
jgi:putative oxidoreductase